MTDIQTAIAQLREAIETGEGWPTIHRAYDALERMVLERYGVNNPIDVMRQLDWALTKSATGTFVNVETYLKQLEEAVCGPSVTVIQAARDVISQSGFVIVNEGRSNEVEVYATDEKAIEVLRTALTALETAVRGEGVDLDARIEAAAEEIEMAIEVYNIEQRQWARARSEAGGNIIADGFIGEALLHELNEWDANNPMPRPKTDIAKKIRRHIKISE